jgi:hypothetical protein
MPYGKESNYYPTTTPDGDEKEPSCGDECIIEDEKSIMARAWEILKSVYLRHTFEFIFIAILAMFQFRWTVLLLIIVICSIDESISQYIVYGMGTLSIATHIFFMMASLAPVSTNHQTNLPPLAPIESPTHTVSPFLHYSSMDSAHPAIC